MSGIVIVRTGGEIGIKSKPVRTAYERLVLRSIKRRMQATALTYSKVWRIAGRIYVECGDPETVSVTLSKLFGVSSTSPGISLPSDIKTIVEIGARLAIKTFMPGTFAVKCRRVGQHGYGSQDVCRSLGEAILSGSGGLKVDLEAPQQVLSVEIRDDMAVIYSEHFRGPDGFPLGAQEPVVGIVDDSFESLIACWSVMKRGSDLRVVSFAKEGSDQGFSTLMKNNIGLLASWKPGKAIRATAIEAPTDLPPESRDAFLLMAATATAQRKGMEALVSGLSPTIGTLKKLNGLPVYPLFPMMAIDQELAVSWASMMGLDATMPFGKDFSTDGFHSIERFKPSAAPSKDFTVKA